MTRQDDPVESTSRVRIAVLGSEDETAPRSLLDWLHHEDELRGRVVLERAAPRPGEMGGLVDALVVALGSGGAGAVPTLPRAGDTHFGRLRPIAQVAAVGHPRTSHSGTDA